MTATASALQNPPHRPVRPRLAFAHLNLRCNPFGEIPLDHRAELAVVDIGEWVQCLAKPRIALQFVGDKGFGKTTYLLALAARFDAAAYVHFPEDGPRPAVPRNGNPLLIDEAQRMSLLQRERTFRRDVPLVLGTHRDFAQALRRCGRTVCTLSVADHLSTTRLHEIVARRIAWSRRGPGPLPTLSRDSVATLLQRHGANIRAVESDLYDRFQNLCEIQDVQV